MRIVLVNWAPIWDGAGRGGGVNGYAQGLALELRDRGHHVSWLSSGLTLTGGETRVVRHPDWLGIRVFEVVDSPVLAPSIAQFAGPGAEALSPVLERVFGRFLARLGPDIVHFHNIEGLSAGCMEEARRTGAAVVYSLHNYHTICPQVYLMRGHREPCFTPENGHACSGCIEADDPAQERARRCVTVASSHLLPTARPRRWRWGGAESHEPAAEAEAGPGWEEVTPGTVLDRAMPLEHDNRGRTRQVIADRGPREDIDPLHPHWRPVENEVIPEPSDPRPCNAYGERRLAMVRALNSCDRVLAVSGFVRERFIAAGVGPERIEVQSIGTRMVSIARLHEELVFSPPGFEQGRPVRLVFMGYNNWYKGLPMLADSLELLVPEVLNRLHVFVYALDGQSMEWRFRRIEPRLGGLTIHHGYEPHDVPWMLGGKDAGLVTSVWWDNAPQTVFEYQACGLPVIGAALGGIPEFVRDGVDGLLFRGNDRYDLARVLARIARDPDLTRRLRPGVRPPKGMEVHAGEVEQTYQDCVSCARRSPA